MEMHFSFLFVYLTGQVMCQSLSILTAGILPGNELYPSEPGMPITNVTEIVGAATAEVTVQLAVKNTTHGYFNISMRQSGYKNVVQLKLLNAPEDANAAKPSLIFNFSKSANLSETITFKSLIKISLLDAVYARPELYYFQIQTSDLPLGAGRGQLMDNTVANGVGVLRENILVANLTGPQVQPNPNPSIFDTAEFSAFVDRNKTRNTTKTMYFSVLTSLFLVNITSLGIYRGDANMTGNILLNLSDPVRFESLNQNRAFRSLIHVNSSIIDNVLDFPSLYYVQLLSKTFPKGVVRSQLHLPPQKMAPSPPRTSKPPPLQNMNVPPPTATSQAQRQTTMFSKQFVLFLFCTLCVKVVF